MKAPLSQKVHDIRARELTGLIALLIVPVAIVGILKLLDFLGSVP